MNLRTLTLAASVATAALFTLQGCAVTRGQETVGEGRGIGEHHRAIRPALNLQRAGRVAGVAERGVDLAAVHRALSGAQA